VRLDEFNSFHRNAMNTMVGRLAPSPTGSQHIGNARTYLIAWLSARKQCGKVLLRIEDIDSPRVKAEATQQIQEELLWLGLNWDEDPIIQTHRMGRYEEALEVLKKKELVYPCTCTRKDIEQSASAPHLEHELPPYPGTCSRRTVSDAMKITDRPCAWRFRSNSPVPNYHDLICGEVKPRFEYGGDFVVWKNNNTPAYQLAVVVDDADMGVTEVIRGDDLIPSTPRQIQLYQALGYPSPKFGHVPLVVGTDGRRLAKRHGDARLATLRAKGISVEKFLGWIGWSCGWLPEVKPVKLEELLTRFSLKLIPRKPFLLTEELLQRLSA
jgi:glutamyl-tRNA synthetase